MLIVILIVVAAVALICGLLFSLIWISTFQYLAIGELVSSQSK